MEIDFASLKGTGKKLFAKLSKDIEEQFLEKVLIGIGPELLECLKLIQAGMDEGHTLLIHRATVATSDDAIGIGIVFCTKQHIVKQVLEMVSEDELTPIDIRLYTTEEFVRSQVKSIKLLNDMTRMIRYFLKLGENPNKDYLV